jgi:transposase, IS5 family
MDTLSQRLSRQSNQRLQAYAGYRGHNAAPDYNVREMRRRCTVEPVIGHLKNEHRMDRNYLHYSSGDATNAILTAIGSNFSLLVRWFGLLLRLIFTALHAALQEHPAPAARRVLHGR